MRTVPAYVSREHRFALGREQGSGALYLSIPVTTGVVDYEEYYEIDQARYDAFMADPDSAVPFADECRDRRHDDLLIRKPGWNRGTPM